MLKYNRDYVITLSEENGTAAITATPKNNFYQTGTTPRVEKVRTVKTYLGGCAIKAKGTLKSITPARMKAIEEQGMGCKEYEEVVRELGIVITDRFNKNATYKVEPDSDFASVIITPAKNGGKAFIQVIGSDNENSANFMGGTEVMAKKQLSRKIK